MKRLFCLVLVVVFAFSLSAAVLADETGAPCEVSVYLDGEKVEFDQQPVIISDRTLVPVRAIFEKLGASVNWDEDTQTAISVKDSTVIMIQINNPKMFVNESSVELDVPAQLVGDRTLVPLRAISESLGCQVNWVETENKVEITSAK